MAKRTRRVFFLGGLGAAALAGLLFVALGLFAGGPARAQQAPNPEVMKRMKYYDKALGVECDYCHVPNKFELETPRKKTAKWMQEHLVDALETKANHQSIDCLTCHDGRARFLPSSQ